MKRKLLIIALLAISTSVFATCYFNWTCTKCNKFYQTSSYNCSYAQSPNQMGGCIQDSKYSHNYHNWVMTGYFER